MGTHTMKCDGSNTVEAHEEEPFEGFLELDLIAESGLLTE